MFQNVLSLCVFFALVYVVYSAGQGPIQIGLKRRERPALVVLSTLDGAVRGFDAATGKTVFQLKPDKPAVNSWAKEGHPEYVPTLDGALYRLDPATGHATVVDSKFTAPRPSIDSTELAMRQSNRRNTADARSDAQNIGVDGIVLTTQDTSAVYISLRTGKVIRSVSPSGRTVNAQASKSIDEEQEPEDDVVILSRTSIRVIVVHARSGEMLANASLTHSHPSFLAKGQCVVPQSRNSNLEGYTVHVSDDRDRVILRSNENGKEVWSKLLASTVVEAHGLGGVQVLEQASKQVDSSSVLPLIDPPLPLPNNSPSRRSNKMISDAAKTIYVEREGPHRYVKVNRPSTSAVDAASETGISNSPKGGRESSGQQNPRKKGHIYKLLPDSGDASDRILVSDTLGNSGFAAEVLARKDYEPRETNVSPEDVTVGFVCIMVICLMAGYAAGRRPRNRRSPDQIQETNRRNMRSLSSEGRIVISSLTPARSQQFLDPGAAGLQELGENDQARESLEVTDRNDVLQPLLESSTGSTGSRSSGGFVASRTLSGLMPVGCLQVSSNVLGVGSHGTVVYEGVMMPGERKVAVKRLLRQFYESARREISLLVQLDEASPHVVRYFAMEEDSEFIYLALELCAGTLAERVASFESPAPPKQYARGPAPVATCRALRQLIQGLADLHKADVVHRDVKPQNVLLSRSAKGVSDIKLADVGLALRLAADRSSYTAIENGGVGTTGWRAPEVLSGGRQTKAVDIFAAGCVVGFVLTKGKHPFGNVIPGRDGNILANRPSLEALEALELPEAYDIVSKMIHPDAACRPSAEQALCHPFFWTDSMKLSFLVDISDRLYDLRKDPHGYTEGLDRTQLAREYCSDWIGQMDMELLTELGRVYDPVASGLLRVIRNKRNHYSELSSSLRKLLGRLPDDESSDESNDTDDSTGLHKHNFLTYFTSRVPHLLMCVYYYALENPALIEQPHFSRYGLKAASKVREALSLHPLVQKLKLRNQLLAEGGSHEIHRASNVQTRAERAECDNQHYEANAEELVDDTQNPSNRVCYPKDFLINSQRYCISLPLRAMDRLKEAGVYSPESAIRWEKRLLTGIFEEDEGRGASELTNSNTVSAGVLTGTQEPESRARHRIEQNPLGIPSQTFKPRSGASYHAGSPLRASGVPPGFEMTSSRIPNGTEHHSANAVTGHEENNAVFRKQLESLKKSRQGYGPQSAEDRVVDFSQLRRRKL